MLVSLSVRNFALIEDLQLEFGPGLNVLTGETGAGKTIAIEALGLCLGERAGAGQVRLGAQRLGVTAVFEADARIKKALEELGLPAGDESLILRREVDSGGKSRCFVNDTPAGLSALARLGELLVETHGQHEHERLLKPAEQRDLLDAFGRLENAREAVAESFGAWKELSAEQQALSLSEQERAQRVDLYKFQKKELDEAALKENEEEELDRLLPQLKNAERLKGAALDAYGLLYGGEGAAVEKVRRALRQLETLQALGADTTEMGDMLREAVAGVEEAAARLDSLAGKVDLDPARLDKVLSRLDAIGKLKKKYGPTLTDVIQHHKKVAEELGRLENLEGRTRDLEGRLAQARKELEERSADLSRERHAAARKLGGAVKKEFSELGLASAGFEVSVAENETGEAGSSGWDTVRFLFSPNPGEGMNSLAEAASGGELSRVMLALKAVLAKADRVQTLLFDEIDAGVGGVLGGAVGRKLMKLGETHQVVCVTHLATIAARAAVHFSVEKETTKDRTRATLRKLGKEERVREIARMFGDDPAALQKGDVSLKHARELLEAGAKI